MGFDGMPDKSILFKSHFLLNLITKLLDQSEYQQAEEFVKAWVYELRLSIRNNANELKAKYGNASIISSKRVVFSIKGNDYRLIVDIEYKFRTPDLS